MTIGKNFPINIFANISGYNMIYNTISQNFNGINEKITYGDEEDYIPTSNMLIYYNGVERGCKKGWVLIKGVFFMEKLIAYAICFAYKKSI